MAKFGHDVHFFNPKITQPVFDHHVSIHLVPVFKFSFFKWISFDVISFFFLVREYHPKKPDCLYFRETSSLTPLIFSKLFSIPLLVEINGWTIQELTESGYSGLKFRYILMVQKLVYKHADKLVPVSRGLATLIQEKYKISPRRIQVIENGTNPDFFHPLPSALARKRTRLPAKRTIIGFIGSCYHYHGVQFLIQAATILVRRYDNIFFVIAGDGEERPRWMRQVSDLALDDYFRFPGKIPFSEAKYYINAFDICVAPWHLEKLVYDSLSPMKLFDYLACEKPVICSPVANIKKWFEENNCGVTVDVTHSQKFADAVIGLLENHEKAREMGKNGRKMVLEHFTWQKTTEKIIKTITEQ